MVCQCCPEIAKTLGLLCVTLSRDQCKIQNFESCWGKWAPQPDAIQPSSKVCLLWEQNTWAARQEYPDYMDMHLQPTIHAHVFVLEKVMLPTLSEHPSSFQINQSTWVTQAQLEVVWGNPVRKALVEDWLLAWQGKIFPVSKISFISYNFTFIRWGITVALAKYWSHISVTVLSYKQTNSLI